MTSITLSLASCAAINFLVGNVLTGFAFAAAAVCAAGLAQALPAGEQDEE